MNQCKFLFIVLVHLNLLLPYIIPIVVDFALTLTLNLSLNIIILDILLYLMCLVDLYNLLITLILFFFQIFHLL